MLRLASSKNDISCSDRTTGQNRRSDALSIAALERRCAQPTYRSMQHNTPHVLWPYHTYQAVLPEYVRTVDQPYLHAGWPDPTALNAQRCGAAVRCRAGR